MGKCKSGCKCNSCCTKCTPGPMGPQGNPGIMGPQGISGIISFRISLSASQIQNGNTTPILVAPAPGAGLATIVTDAEWQFSNTIAFTSQNLELTEDSTVFGSGQWSASGLNNAGANVFRGMTYVGQAGANITIISNAALYILIDSDSVVGNGTGVVYGTYRIITI